MLFNGNMKNDNMKNKLLHKEQLTLYQYVQLSII